MATTASIWLVAIYFVEAALMVWRLHLGALYNTDTSSYLFFNPVVRTPLYPLLIRGWLFAAGPFDYLVWLSASQAVIFGCSIPLFVRLALRAGKWAGLTASALYSIYVPFSSWSLSASTEAVAIPLSVITFYAAASLMRRCSAARLLWLLAMVTLLMLLRPAFAYVAIALALVGCGLAFCRGRRHAALGLMVCAIWSSGIWLAYSSFVSGRTGVFTPSVIGLHNQFYTQRLYGRLVPEAATDSVLRAELTRMVESRPDFRGGRVVSRIWCETADVFRIASASEMERVLAASDAAQSVRDRLDNFIGSFGEPLVSAGFNEGCDGVWVQMVPARLMRKSGITLAVLYVTMMLMGLCRAWWVFRLHGHRSMGQASGGGAVGDGEWWLAWLLVAGNVGAVVAGYCPIDFGRLLLPSLPLWLLLVVWTVRDIHDAFVAKKSLSRSQL